MPRHAAASDPRVLRELLAATGELRLVVAGASMSPTLRAGDSVVVRPLAAPPRLGDVVVYARAGQLWCHRVLVPGRSLITKGDARGRPDAPVGREAVVGLVIAVQRGGRLMGIRGLSARLAGLALNLAAPAAALGRRLARHVGVSARSPARRLPLAGFEVEISGPKELLRLLGGRRGRGSGPADFRIALDLRHSATTGGRYGLVAGRSAGLFGFSSPAVVARLDLRRREAQAELVAGSEVLGLAGLLRIAGILLATGPGEGLALHASAVRRQGRAWLFSGSGGTGKSTARRRSCEAGAEPLADDLVLLRPGGEAGRWLAWAPVLELEAEMAPTPERRGTPVAGLIIPARGAALAVERLSPARWTALGGSFPPGAPPSPEILERLGRLAESVPAWRVRFADRAGGLAGLFEKLEAAD